VWFSKAIIGLQTCTLATERRSLVGGSVQVVGHSENALAAGAALRANIEQRGSTSRSRRRLSYARKKDAYSSGPVGEHWIAPRMGIADLEQRHSTRKNCATG
jgi:hypothetical protein